VRVETEQTPNERTDSESDSNRESAEQSFKWILWKHLSLDTQTVWFTLRSAVEIRITYLLLTKNAVVNPVGAFFINLWGVGGIVIFKVALVAFIVVAVQIIAQKRPRTAHALLSFGTKVVVAVLIYFALFSIRGPR